MRTVAAAPAFVAGLPQLAGRRTRQEGTHRGSVSYDTKVRYERA